MSSADAPAGFVTDLDPMDPAYLADPYPGLADLREAAPVAFSPSVGYWMVTRYADVEAVFMDPVTYSARIAQDPLLPLSDEASGVLAGGFGATPTMSNCDPPKHGRIRKQNMKSFSARRLGVLEPTVRARCEELVDRLLTRVDADGSADLVEELAFPLPAVVVFALIGFPEGDTERLKDWCTDRMSFSWGRPSASAQTRIAEQMTAYWKYCESFVEQRLTDPRDDFTSDLLQVHLDDPEAVSVDEIVNVTYGLSFAGHETTTGLIGNAVRRLLEIPERWAQLRADPSLISNAVEEVLRHDTSVIAWRRITTRPVELGGVALPVDAKLLLMLAAANRDPERFPDPDTFDPHRRDARQHLSFGKGIHFCLGAALTRLELGIMLEQLLDRAPELRLVDGQPLSFAPNVAFRGPQTLRVTS
jgi:cytochrome P450